MILLRQIKIPVLKDHENNLLKKICEKCKISSSDILTFRIVKKSIDARDKKNILYVYEVCVSLKDEEKVFRKCSSPDILLYEEVPYVFPKGKKMPDKIICMSPWLDLTGSGESYKTNLYKDVMFGIGKHSVKEEGKNIPAQNKTEEGETLEGGENKKPMIAWYADDNDLYDEYLSPVFAQFYGFPKMLVQVGTWELLQSDSRTLYEKAKAAGVDVTLQEYEGMFHVFQLCPEIIPEVKKAWKEIKKFVLEE